MSDVEPKEPVVNPGTAVSYWLANATDAPSPPLPAGATADVAIVGGGFTGLWTAIRLLETEPALRVTVLEMEQVGFGASGRNGGFCEASLTHGLANGIAHFPDEVRFLRAEGERNLAELVAFTRERRIECDLEPTGTIRLADQAYQVEAFQAWAEEAAGYGEHLRFLDREAVQAEVHSPLWQAGLVAGPETNVMIDPAKLARGLKRAAIEMGATVHEGTRVVGVERRAGGVTVRSAGGGSVRASHVVVATSAYTGWLGWRAQRLFVPVYDYVLVSEPLTEAQREAIGWRGRQGLSDSNNQFHYFRLTADDRILWGGYEAIHYFGSQVGPHLDRRPATFALLESQFVRAFPQLDSLRFPWRWGGPIDTTSDFSVTFGQALGGRLTYALGYTGLGVGASRWAAGVVRDHILRPDSDVLRLRLVRRTPFPFPPEPLRSAAVNLVRRELARADENEGRRSLLLRALDAVGIGFGS